MLRPPPSFAERVRGTVARYGMLTPADRVLVAMSGGPDSVALFEVLLDLGFRVEVAHLDHQTREGASLEDAAFVRELAEARGVAVHCESRPVAAEAAAAGKSFEQHARDVRYAFFLRVAHECGCTAIATGHHADDQVETVLMRLLQGCGPQALAGIPPVRKFSVVRVVRPLIEVAREEILSYVDGCGRAYRNDASNADVSIPRNRIRNELLPLLERGYNPRVREAILRLAEQQRTLNTFLIRQEEEAIETCLLPEGAIDRTAFAKLDAALAHRVALHVARAHGVRAGAAQITALTEFMASGASGRRFDLGNDVLFHNSETVSEVVNPAASQRDADAVLPVPGAVDFLGWRFAATVSSCLPGLEPREFCTPTRQVFDADRVAGELHVRTRRNGDRFNPLGMKGTRKLSDYFVDRRIPAIRRDRIPLILSGDRIVWVVGHAPAAAAALTSRTRRYLVIEIAELEPEVPDEIE